MESEPEVTKNQDKHQFEIQLGQELALLTYRQHSDRLELIHTEVPVSQRGKGFGQKLVKFAMEYAKQNQLRAVAICPFAQAYTERHPDAV